VIRNAIVFHRFILAADSSTVIAGANCHDTYYGHDIGWWSNACLERARTRTQLLEGAASTGAAVTFAGHHMTRLPLVAAIRALRTFDLFQPLRQGNREPRRKWVDIVGLALYFPLLVLAVLGAIRLRARRWILLAPVWMALIVSITGWGIGRFRVAADVSIIVLAAYRLVGPTETFHRFWRPREPPGVVLESSRTSSTRRILRPRLTAPGSRHFPAERSGATH
jgi:hypothetical protein